MSKTYNNRARSDRYQGNRAYIHQPGSVEWWRGAFALAAVAVSAWFVWHFGLSSRAKESGFHSSRGNLTLKHAAWNDKCDACHVPADQLRDAEDKEFWNVNARWKELSCKHCHAGPAHHTYTKEADSAFDKDCAACHHDHSGQNYSLVRISDQHCTRCHAELQDHPNRERNSGYAEHITHFGKADGHPQFKALTQEHDRSIKFSHALHMAPGIFVNQKPSKPDDMWSVKYVEKADRENGTTYAERYRRFEKTGEMTNEKGEVVGYSFTQLDCMACHELDSGRRSNADWNGTDKIVPEAPKESLLLPRAEGAYYLPVNFEKHCQACHPIGINLNTRELGELKIKLPHRKQLKDFDDTLFDRVMTAFLVKSGTVKDAGSIPMRLDRPVYPLSDEGKQKVNALFDETKKSLNQPVAGATERGNLAIQTSGSTCIKCHFVTKEEDGKTGRTDFLVKPGNTPTVWFEHSKFSHVGHRAMNCVECHANMGQNPAYEPGSGKLVWTDPEEWGTAGKKPDPVGIMGIEGCQKCHSPSRVENGVRLGGVRHDCTDCHRYHNAEYPLQGMGALNRDPHPDPNQRLDGTQLLDGAPPAKNRK